MRRRRPLLLSIAVASALACGAEPAPRSGGPPVGWSTYGGGSGGTRYSALDEIRPENVAQLEQAWVYHTGDLPDAATADRNHSFQATPILMGDALFFCTPRSRVVSLDAESGAERWVYDPEVDLSLGHYNLNCRGVASWRDPEAAGKQKRCARRIYVASADARLLALDADSGRPCPGFGAAGQVDFSRDVGPFEPG